MVVLSINAVGGFAESVAGRFVCESLAVGVDPEVEGLPRNGIKVAEELNAFTFCTKVADEADRASFCTAACALREFYILSLRRNLKQSEQKEKIE